MATILTATALYWTTAIDLVLILVTLFAMYQQKRDHQRIMMGQIIGSVILITVPLVLAIFLRQLPAEWLLGLLGLIPLGFGIKYLFAACSADEKAAEVAEQRSGKSLVGTVILITVASCGPDNIGLFTPYFTSLSGSAVVTAIVTFMVNIIVMAVVSRSVGKLRTVAEVFERFGRWIMATVYMALGLMILVEANSIPNLLHAVGLI